MSDAATTPTQSESEKKEPKLSVAIIAGGNFGQCVKDLELEAQCDYFYHPPKDLEREEYQVWRLSRKSYNKMLDIPGDDWEEGWGWWRWAKGSNLFPDLTEFTVHEQPLLGFIGYKRQQWMEECEDCLDYHHGDCPADPEDIDECYGPRVFKDLCDYVWNEVGATSERNFTAVCVDLAKYNKITLGELFRKYLG